MSPSERLGAGRWYRPADVARLLGVPYHTVQSYARQLADQLQALRDERDRLHFSESDLEVLRRHHEQPRPEGLTLGQIAARLGVPSHRLKRVVAPLKPILPRLDTARKGLYAPEAVEILRKQLVRAGRKTQTTNEAAEYWRALARLRVATRQLGQIAAELLATYDRLRKNPPSVMTYIHTLPAPEWVLVRPLAVVISPLRRTYWRATLVEAKLHGSGATIEDAVGALQVAIVRALRAGDTPRELRDLLRKLARQKRRSRGEAKTSEPSSAKAAER
jgi:DNA-binding transcriptional MerR regulator